MAVPIVSPVRVHVHPDQAVPRIWYRKGPEWADATGSGYWMVNDIYNVAVRVVLDPALPTRTEGWFTDELEDARKWREIREADDFLRRLSPPPRKPRKPRAKPVTLQAAVESQIEDILRSA